MTAVEKQESIVFLEGKQQGLKRAILDQIKRIRATVEITELLAKTNNNWQPASRNIIYEELRVHETVLANLDNIYISRKGVIMMPHILDGCGHNQYLNIYLDCVIKLHSLATGARRTSIRVVKYYTGNEN